MWRSHDGGVWGDDRGSGVMTRCWHNRGFLRCSQTSADSNCMKSKKKNTNKSVTNEEPKSLFSIKGLWRSKDFSIDEWEDDLMVRWKMFYQKWKKKTWENQGCGAAVFRGGRWNSCSSCSLLPLLRGRPILTGSTFVFSWEWPKNVTSLCVTFVCVCVC